MDTLTTEHARNKKAYHNFEILEEFEAGIVLEGHEVKSIKANQISLLGSYVGIKNNQAYLIDANIAHYKFSPNKEQIQKKDRKLLLHKKQIFKIEKELSQKGIACVPLRVFSRKGLIKVIISLCRGKKIYDKRQDLKKRSQEIEIKRSLKHY